MTPAKKKHVIYTIESVHVYYYYEHSHKNINKSRASDAAQGAPHRERTGAAHWSMKLINFWSFRWSMKLRCSSSLWSYWRKTGGNMTTKTRSKFNPISGRLLATPISGRGGCLGPTPLRSPVPTGRFLKFKRHSFHLNMIYISKKKRNFKNS